jgi:hypothetical protein
MMSEIERRFAEEILAALLLEDQQFALDGADRGLGDIAVFAREVG